ncbi:MAG: hypothetical protein LBG22_09940 [Treponema sp.]|jgi:hypothetical protein|nr:hypothetical protein [Treponema sp.]
MIKKNAAGTVLCAAVFLTFLHAPLWPEEAAGKPDSAISDSTTVNLTISSLPEAALGITEKLSIPFLRGDSPLTEGNNLSASFTAEFTPVSINGYAEFVWTPLAFLQFVSGGRAGSGWNIELFGSDVRGIGLNRRRADGTAWTDAEAFGGLTWMVKAGAVFQFDAASLFPGDWNHVVLRLYQELNFSSFSSAKAGESWYYANDFGENRNGQNYYASYLFGYQMPRKPLFLDMTALMAEQYRFLCHVPGGDAWGDDLDRWVFSALFNFSFTGWFSTALITQVRTMRNFSSNTADLEFYQDRRMADGNPLRLEFYRVAAIFSFKLRQPADGALRKLSE